MSFPSLFNAPVQTEVKPLQSKASKNKPRLRPGSTSLNNQAFDNNISFTDEAINMQKANSFNNQSTKSRNIQSQSLGIKSRIIKDSGKFKTILFL